MKKKNKLTHQCCSKQHNVPVSTSEVLVCPSAKLLRSGPKIKRIAENHDNEVQADENNELENSEKTRG